VWYEDWLIVGYVTSDLCFYKVYNESKDEDVCRKNRVGEDGWMIFEGKGKVECQTVIKCGDKIKNLSKEIPPCSLSSLRNSPQICEKNGNRDRSFHAITSISVSSEGGLCMVACASGWLLDFNLNELPQIRTIRAWLPHKPTFNTNNDGYGNDLFSTCVRFLPYKNKNYSNYFITSFLNGEISLWDGNKKEYPVLNNQPKEIVHLYVPSPLSMKTPPGTEVLEQENKETLTPCSITSIGIRKEGNLFDIAVGTASSLGLVFLSK
jgi:hypothetical protein